VSEALATMRTFYNGYRFSEEATESLYNPTLSLYFLKALARTGAIRPAGCSTRIWPWTATNSPTSRPCPRARRC
jgi:hypothetical protein